MTPRKGQMAPCEATKRWLASRDGLKIRTPYGEATCKHSVPSRTSPNERFQGGNNVKASLGVCFALSRNYVSSYRGTAIMRKKMHATVFSIRYRRGSSPERLHVEVYEPAGEMPRLKLGVVIEAGRSPAHSDSKASRI